MSHDPVLARIAEEAQRLTGGTCAVRVHGDADSVLVVEPSGESIVRGRWLHRRLSEFCMHEGLAQRFLVVGATAPKFLSRPAPLPDGWPPEAEGA